MAYFLLLLTVIFAPLAYSSELIPKSWRVYSNPGIPVFSKQSKLPVQGNYIASIEPMMLALTEETKIADIDKYSFGWVDFYYFGQTINAKKHLGNHLHVSGYFKLDKRKAQQYFEDFRTWFTLDKIAYYQENEIEYDIKDIQNHTTIHKFERLLKYSEIKFFVLTHKNGKYVSYSSTNDFSYISNQWQRLNVEVDVPNSSESITIVVRMRGIGNFYLDDFSVSDQGKKLSTKVSRLNKLNKNKKLDEMLGKWVNNGKKDFHFDNLSFENSHKPK